MREGREHGSGASTARGGRTLDAPGGAYGEVSSCSGFGLQRSRAGCSPGDCGRAEGPGAAAVPGELIHTHPPAQTNTNQLKPAEASTNEMEVVRVGAVPPEKTSRRSPESAPGGSVPGCSLFPRRWRRQSRESHGFPSLCAGGGGLAATASSIRASCPACFLLLVSVLRACFCCFFCQGHFPVPPCPPTSPRRSPLPSPEA